MRDELQLLPLPRTLEATEPLPPPPGSWCPACPDPLAPCACVRNAAAVPALVGDRGDVDIDVDVNL